VEVDLQRAVVADDQHRVAEALERLAPRIGLEPLAGHREVRAVLVGRGLVLRMRDARRRVVLELGRRRAAQRGDHAREEDRQPVAAGVDDARGAQDLEQVGRPLDRLLPGVQCLLEHVGQHGVLARLGHSVAEPRLGRVGDLRGHARRHLAHHGEDRALRGRAHRPVRALHRPRHGRGDQHRVDELAGPRDQLLRGAADELGEDHARVATRPEQRGARHRVDDLVAPDLVELALGGEPVELVEHGVQRERHVVPGVAVGDREHVEVVDLLAARLELGQRPLDDGTEADEAGIGHRVGTAPELATPW
jgi:hypothetical protein